MLPAEDLFVYVYVLIDDLITARAIAIPPRPGPAPACSDAELLTIAQVRHLLGRRSEAGFLAEVTRDWAHLFPRLPHQSEANRRTRWLWGAFEQLRCYGACSPAPPPPSPLVPSRECAWPDSRPTHITRLSTRSGTLVPAAALMAGGLSGSRS